MKTVKTLLRKIAWFKRKVIDPYSPSNYVELEVFVPKPDKENPLPCILVSIRNGHSRLFFRCANVKEYLKAFSLSREVRARLQTGLLTANIEADEIEKDMRLLFARRKLAPGDRIVNTRTGEVYAEGLAEAEGIIDGSR